LPPGAAYRAYFRLKTDRALETRTVASLDVTQDNGATILGLKRVRGTDFAGASEYQEFYVDFYYPGDGALEFRARYEATASLWLDRIIVVSRPIPFAPSASWTLTGAHGQKVVRAKFTDGAGNISVDAEATISFSSAPPTSTPTATPPALLTPRIWLPFVERRW
jgi:hypothetical protein